MSLIDTSLTRSIHTTPIFERRFDCYESAYEIHSANRAFESWIAESLHSRGGNDHQRRNRTEREDRKWEGGEESERKNRELAQSRDESMKASGFAEGWRRRVGGRRGFEWMRILQSARFDFALTASGYRMIHHSPGTFRAPFQPSSPCPYPL